MKSHFVVKTPFKRSNTFNPVFHAIRARSTCSSCLVQHISHHLEAPGARKRRHFHHTCVPFGTETQSEAPPNGQTIRIPNRVTKHSSKYMKSAPSAPTVKYRTLQFYFHIFRNFWEKISKKVTSHTYFSIKNFWIFLYTIMHHLSNFQRCTCSSYFFLFSKNLTILSASLNNHHSGSLRSPE